MTTLEPPPDVFTRWWRIDSLAALEGSVNEGWAMISAAEREFWLDLEERLSAPQVTPAALAKALRGRRILVSEKDTLLRLDDGMWDVLPARPEELAFQLLTAIDPRLGQDPGTQEVTGHE